MLHQEIPVNCCLCLVGLVEKMTVTSEVNPKFVFQIEKFIK